jgi:hypothetical protein
VDRDDQRFQFIVCQFIGLETGTVASDSAGYRARPTPFGSAHDVLAFLNPSPSSGDERILFGVE